MSRKKDKHADISIENIKEENFIGEEQDASFLGATQASGQVPLNQENNSSSNKENQVVDKSISSIEVK